MEKVDYLKLSEQYAGFMVAIGGVGITVLALVLSFGPESPTPIGVTSRSFLVGSLVVATVTCFIGAQMMAETAAFTQFYKNKQMDTGIRLFLLASTNIFIAAILLLFSLILLPQSSGRVHVASFAPISITIFLIIIGAALYWMILGVYFRVCIEEGKKIVWWALVIGLIWGVMLYSFSPSERYPQWTLRIETLLWLTFLPSIVSTVGSLIWFAWIFKKGKAIYLQEARVGEVWFFTLAITVSYASLVAAGIEILLGKQS